MGQYAPCAEQIVANDARSPGEVVDTQRRPDAVNRAQTLLGASCEQSGQPPSCRGADDTWQPRRLRSSIVPFTQQGKEIRAGTHVNIGNPRAERSTQGSITNEGIRAGGMDNDTRPRALDSGSKGVFVPCVKASRGNTPLRTRQPVAWSHAATRGLRDGERGMREQIGDDETNKHGCPTYDKHYPGRSDILSHGGCPVRVASVYTDRWLRCSARVVDRSRLSRP